MEKNAEKEKNNSRVLTIVGWHVNVVKDHDVMW